ncbi:MAG TPA: DUF4301 family protein [Thermoanaerobaculia bacterium]|jgi:hypothetical protein|nr:DUF4301 family protein [Thermoanaerobaculia bacterium]
MIDFSTEDLAQLRARGISVAEAERQLALLRHPPHPARVLRPCCVGDGIRRIDETEIAELIHRAESVAREGRVSKLVPASGAASRMFQALAADLDASPDADDVEPSAETARLLAELHRLPFAEALAAALAAEGHDLADLRQAGRSREILRSLLHSSGLGFAEMPKGLIPFHRAEAAGRTPFEEHLREAAALIRDAAGVCRLHFTVAPEHEPRFRALLDELAPRLAAQLGARFEVGFSIQHPRTDTLALDLSTGEPFRTEDGALLFRPGGHGALIENLAELASQGADLVLIKNVDNVLPGGGPPEVLTWKRVLLGLAAGLSERAGDLRRALERPAPEEDQLRAAERFLTDEFGRSPFPSSTAGPATNEERRQALIAALDRPLRVCGVVENTGEPGGGPFWVAGEEGATTPQLVEASQLDPERRADLLAAATHFNPVDLVCALRIGGRRLDPLLFVDPSAVFVTEKSHGGRPLLGLERPGLWNGAMAGWNTVFVEVPNSTFAPVKTVLDLLRPEHQG